MKTEIPSPDEAMIFPRPGLPIFGTVSAATPIPSPATETLPAISSSLAGKGNKHG